MRSCLVALPLFACLAMAAAAAAQSEPAGCGRNGCHVEMERRASVHETASGWDCESCHPPVSGGGAPAPHHRGAIPSALGPPDGDGGCLACHGESYEPLRLGTAADDAEAAEGNVLLGIFAHEPVQEGLCAPCHTAHGAASTRLVRGELPHGLYAVYERDAYSACYGSCHEPALVEVPRTQTATRFRNGDDNLHYRHVVGLERGRSCRLCHEPHLATNRALIREAMPFGEEQLTLSFTASDSGGDCLTTCHIPVAYDRESAIPSRMRVRAQITDEERP